MVTETKTERHQIKKFILEYVRKHPGITPESVAKASLIPERGGFLGGESRRGSFIKYKMNLYVKAAILEKKDNKFYVKKAKVAEVAA